MFKDNKDIKAYVNDFNIFFGAKINIIYFGAVLAPIFFVFKRIRNGSWNVKLIARALTESINYKSVSL